MPNTPWPMGPCATMSCVDIETKDDGKTFDFFSTLGADKGRVTYNADEVATFLADVKTGKWDHVEQLAKARVAELAPAAKPVDWT